MPGKIFSKADVSVSPNTFRSLHGIDKDTKPCIFISHRKADAQAAQAVAEYLIAKLNVFVYLDALDPYLASANSTQDSKGIVEAIDTGLSISTQLLGIISSNTKGSWWVPYEFGGARLQNKPTAFILLNSVTDLPDYMKISRLITDVTSLDSWVNQFPIRSMTFQKSVNPLVIPGFSNTRTQPINFTRD